MPNNLPRFDVATQRVRFTDFGGAGGAGGSAIHPFTTTKSTSFELLIEAALITDASRKSQGRGNMGDMTAALLQQLGVAVPIIPASKGPTVVPPLLEAAFPGRLFKSDGSRFSSLALFSSHEGIADLDDVWFLLF
jgi:hypothetical protein